MKFNGVDLTAYGAKLTKRELESAEHLINTEWPSGALVPYVDPLVNYRYKTLRIEIEFKGSTPTIEQNKSKFKAESMISVISEHGLGINSLSGYLDTDTLSMVTNGYQRVEYEFKVLEEKSQITATITNSASGTVTNTGTSTTPARLEFTPSASGNYIVKINPNSDDEIVININGATANVMRSIDASTGIWEGAVNKFGSTLIMDFPRLKAGANTVTISPVTAKSIFIFKPRMV